MAAERSAGPRLARMEGDCEEMGVVVGSRGSIERRLGPQLQERKRPQRGASGRAIAAVARCTGRSRHLLVALAGVLLLQTGCGTLITQVDGPLFAPGDKSFNWDGKASSPIYSGTRLSWGGVRKSDIFYVWIVDLPLSFVADTALLPLSLIQDVLSRIFGGGEEEEVLTPKASPAP
jgi:uncharacterized protein YceK